MSTWQLIETAPKGNSVLVFYENSLGKGRIIKAFYAEQHAIESDEENSDYCEERDAYFIPEGWYECIDNWDDFAYVKIYNGTPTHWMPLPEAPK